MSDSNLQKTFIYTCGNHRNKVFPIDYSLAEYQRTTNPVPTRTSVEHLLSNKEFYSTLNNMLLDRGDSLDEAIADMIKGRPAIPLETKLFFDEMLALYHDPTCTYSKELRLDELNHSATQEVLRDYTYQLFQRLCDKISTGNPSSEAQFACHVLMNDSVFSAAILDKLWKTELQPRVGRIKNLAQGVPSAKQLECFLRCLSVLDEISFELSCEQAPSSQPEQSEKDESTGFQLQHVLEILLSERSQRQLEAPGKWAMYSLDNIAIKPGDMQKAFSDAGFLKGKLELVRAEYLKNLATKTKRKASQFEKIYLNLREYLDSSKVRIEDNELRQLIDNRCRKTGIDKIQKLIGAHQIKKICNGPPLPPNKYLSSLIDHTINNMISSQLAKFGDFYSTFETYNDLYPQMSDLIHSLLTGYNALTENDRTKMTIITFTATENIREALSTIDDVPICAWNTIYKNDDNVSDINKTTYFVNSKIIAKKLADDALIALKYFKIELNAPISSDNIQKIIDTHKESIKTFNTASLWGHFKDYTEQIYYAVLLITLHRIMQDAESNLVKRTRFFVDALTSDDAET